jgi:hypothetical protein
MFRNNSNALIGSITYPVIVFVLSRTSLFPCAAYSTSFLNFEIEKCSFVRLVSLNLNFSWRKLILKVNVDFFSLCCSAIGRCQGNSFGWNTHFHYFVENFGRSLSGFFSKACSTSGTNSYYLKTS